MDNEKTCENCKYIGFHDWYLCTLDLSGDINYIDDINNICNNFEKREKPFWENTNNIIKEL